MKRSARYFYLSLLCYCATSFLCTVIVKAGQLSYYYDSLNRLTNVDYGSGSTISYTYDSAGNRLIYSGAVANDAVLPTISIMSPTSGPSFNSSNATLNLSGTAADNTSVSLITWSNDRGGIGTAVGTTNWAISAIPLREGTNLLSVTAYDPAGNSSVAALRVLYSLPPPLRITGFAINSNATAQLNCTGPTGVVLNVQTSTNLVQWYSLGMVTNVTGSFQFPFPFSFSDQKRFFRLIVAGGNAIGNALAINAGGSGDDTTVSVATGSNGITYVTGTFQGTATFGPTNLTSRGQRDIFLAAYDATGQLIWITQEGGNYEEAPRGMAVDVSGNIFLVGWFTTSTTIGTNNLTGSVNGTAFIAKYDSTGKLIWVHQVSSSSASFSNACAVDQNGDLYVTGFFHGTGIFWDGPSKTSAGFYGIFLSKVSADGHALWVNVLGDESSDNFGSGVAVDANLNCFLTGLYAHRTFLAKFDNTGSPQWTNQYDISSYWPSVASDNMGGVYFIANINSSANFGGISVTNIGGTDAVLGRFDGSSNALWMRVLGGINDDEIHGLATDPNANCVATGFFQGLASIGTNNLTSFGGKDVFVVKYAPDGTPLWTAQAGGSSDDEGNNIAVDSAGGIWTIGDFLSGTAIFNGISLTNQGGMDAFIMKLPEAGP